MKAKHYEVLARLQYDEPLILWHECLTQWYVLTKDQAEWNSGNGFYGSFINGETIDEPPYYIAKGWTKRAAWKKACNAKS